jgi:hypothetical protein
LQKPAIRVVQTSRLALRDLAAKQPLGSHFSERRLLGFAEGMANDRLLGA